MRYITQNSLLSCMAILLTSCGSAYQSIELPLSIKPSNYYHPKTTEYFPLMVKQKTISLKQLSNQGITTPDKLTVDGKEIAPNTRFSIGDLYSDGVHKKQFKAQKKSHIYSGELYIYQKLYSIAITDRVLNTDDPTYANKKGQLHINIISGLPFFDVRFFKRGGNISYQGKAYYRDQVGDIKYSIDYYQQNNNPNGSGSGKITGLSHYGQIELAKGEIGINTAQDSSINFQGNSLEGDKLYQTLVLNITGVAQNIQGEIGSYALGIYGVKYPSSIMGGVVDKKTQEHIFFNASVPTMLD